MLEKSFSLLFFLRKPKNYLKGKMPIYLRITVDGYQKEISIARQVDPDRWNANSQRCYGSKEDIKSLNAYLDTVQTKVYEARRQLLDKNELITVDSLKDILKGTKGEIKTIMQVFKQHNEEVEALVDKGYSATTLTRYKTSYDHTKSFIEWKYGVSDMDIKKLDYEFVTQFEFWFKAVRNCNHNTTIKYISNFRKVVNRCIKNGWLARDPFFGFKMTKKEVVPEFLTDDELMKIVNKRFSSERLTQVKDIFLFCCYTGLAFVDVAKLKSSEIGIGVDGKEWILTKRKKTNTQSRIPLLRIAKAILSKYQDCPGVQNQDKLLPVLSNQKYNEYLKEIATICGVHKNLTTHAARHTFATTVTLNNGVPIETVSKMLGHKSIKMTQIYAKILDRKVSEDMSMLEEKFKRNTREIEAKNAQNLSQFLPEKRENSKAI